MAKAGTHVRAKATVDQHEESNFPCRFSALSYCDIRASSLPNIHRIGKNLNDGMQVAQFHDSGILGLSKSAAVTNQLARIPERL
ncbi:hypothetical protein CNE_1c33320 [Cupriavidus necator N-1]|uniref:Uncharacterized protein n=1 Tax=Cupriavidus necator (strain ATCC 43291 / DSM 13513 / CCUG 52238 / LMG 8453 / N-1) TaxID=1042878 RepID=G0EY23_CUPNN|nr:hypothetical protein [Cupriavidus necator]AEI78636.1 hypothetical protein CNE_1c33320 [Cupriavidus necator N-1]MDX6012839.1 hypothetical protein [Cupriavidus necator]